MLDRFERPLKIVCLAMAVLLTWQFANLILRGDPLARLRIPDLPTLPGATNDSTASSQKETNAVVANKDGTNLTSTAVGANTGHGTNVMVGTNVAKGTNLAQGTNVVIGSKVTIGSNVFIGSNSLAGTNSGRSTNALAQSTNGGGVGDSVRTNGGPGTKPGGSGKPGQSGEIVGSAPDAKARKMGEGMPGGHRGGGVKKVELPPDVQARVDRIIDSEILGPTPRPMPLSLIGIADQEAFIQATNGQSGPVKIGGEMGGIKLLRIGVNRVLIEDNGEKKELTLFEGVGGQSLMPKSPDSPATNTPAAGVDSTNSPSINTNAPAKKAPIRNAAVMRRARLSLLHVGFLPLFHRLVEDRVGERRLAGRIPAPCPSPRWRGARGSKIVPDQTLRKEQRCARASHPDGTVLVRHTLSSGPYEISRGGQPSAHLAFLSPFGNCDLLVNNTSSRQIFSPKHKETQ